MIFDIQLLGKFVVAVDGVAIAPAEWRRDRAAALIKLLAITPNHRLRREQVMDLFWPDADPEAAGTSLRKAVYFARKALGKAEAIATVGDSVALGDGFDVRVDAQHFETAARAALKAPSAAGCAAAADLYAGELLPDDLYVDWLEGPRSELAQLHLALLRGGALWERLIAAEPSDEPAYLQLMESALAAGNRAEAIRLFNALRQHLNVELGLGPSAKAVALYEQALATSPIEASGQTDRIRAALAWGLLHLNSGEFDKARVVAEETRQLAMAAGLVREVGEASALFALCAHMQGRWKEVFRTEFIDWARKSPDKVSQIFDGHLCLAEFCMCSAKGHQEIGGAALELLAVAEGAGSLPGRGLASLILGEAAMFSGHLGEAERLLTIAEALLAEADAPSGRALALERLAELALARGQKWKAGRLIQRALGIAAQSWIAPHLVIRLQGLLVRAAPTKPKALQAIAEGDRLLADQSHGCQPCSMAFRVASATVLAEMHELSQVGRRLDEAERIAGMWQGGPWAAAVWEARGVQRRAEGAEGRAVSAFEEAASSYAALGRPADEARCRDRITATDARQAG